MYKCTEAYTGQAFYKVVPEKHGHVYLVTLYTISIQKDTISSRPNIIQYVDMQNWNCQYHFLLVCLWSERPFFLDEKFTWTAHLDCTRNWWSYLCKLEGGRPETFFPFWNNLKNSQFYLNNFIFLQHTTTKNQVYIQGDQLNMAVFFWYSGKRDLYSVRVYNTVNLKSPFL